MRSLAAVSRWVEAPQRCGQRGALSDSAAAGALGFGLAPESDAGPLKMLRPAERYSRRATRLRSARRTAGQIEVYLQSKKHTSQEPAHPAERPRAQQFSTWF